MSLMRRGYKIALYTVLLLSAVDGEILLLPVSHFENVHTPLYTLRQLTFKDVTFAIATCVFHYFHSN